MDSFEINKLLGGLLGTCFVVFSLGLISDGLFASPAPEKPGYAIKAVEPEAGGAAAPAEDPPIASLLPKAEAKAGEAIFKKCQACHDGTKGGPNKVGPNLYGVVDRPIASHPGFSYSTGMKEFSKGSTEHWTFDNLYHFLKSPKNDVKGTAMGFAGLPKPEDRANVLAYLRTLSDNPVPLPAAPAADASKPADASAKPADASAKPADAAKPAAPADATKPAAPAQ